MIVLIDLIASLLASFSGNLLANLHGEKNHKK